jgi:hypothetical protein
MPWIDERTKTIRSSLGKVIVASFANYDDISTWWYLAKPNKNKKYKYPNNLEFKNNK